MNERLLRTRLFSNKEVQVINKEFDPLLDSLSFAGQCIMGYYSYYDDSSKVS